MANVEDTSGVCCRCHRYASWLSPSRLCGVCDEYEHPRPPQKTVAERIAENEAELARLKRAMRASQ